MLGKLPFVLGYGVYCQNGGSEKIFFQFLTSCKKCLDAGKDGYVSCTLCKGQVSLKLFIAFYASKLNTHKLKLRCCFMGGNVLDDKRKKLKAKSVSRLMFSREAMRALKYNY